MLDYYLGTQDIPFFFLQRHTDTRPENHLPVTMAIIHRLTVALSNFRLAHFSEGPGRYRGVLRLPPPPRKLIEDRLRYEESLLGRKIDIKNDQPLLALYRMYEHFILGQHLQLRKEFEAFWSHGDWPISQIPDPKDKDPGRYTCLACIPRLLVLAFNQRIELGIPRKAPTIFTSDQFAKWKTQRKQYEKLPSWVESVPRKKRNKFQIPYWNDEQQEFVTLDPSEWHHASQECLEQGIVAYKADIRFA